MTIVQACQAQKYMILNIAYIDQQTLLTMSGKHYSHYMADIADWISQIYFDWLMLDFHKTFTDKRTLLHTALHSRQHCLSCCHAGALQNGATPKTAHHSTYVLNTTFTHTV
tara:strand:- start:39 stop:371 length:333 start_codon:yes stop_codon:yes gene_type:complete